MIHIEWWSRSSSDDPDRVWSSDDVLDQVWSSDDDPDEDDLNMNMTWRWRWREVDYDSNDTEKNTCVNKLCWDNAFLVKRECWCNCNFRMYSLVFLIYCNPIFIPGCILMYLSHVIPRCLFWEVSIMRNLCQFIMGNAPIGWRRQSPHKCWGTRVIRHS